MTDKNNVEREKKNHALQVALAGNGWGKDEGKDGYKGRTLYLFKMDAIFEKDEIKLPGTFDDFKGLLENKNASKIPYERYLINDFDEIAEPIESLENNKDNFKNFQNNPKKVNIHVLNNIVLMAMRTHHEILCIKSILEASLTNNKLNMKIEDKKLSINYGLKNLFKTEQEKMKNVYYSNNIRVVMSSYKNKNFVVAESPFFKGVDIKNSFAIFEDYYKAKNNKDIMEDDFKKALDFFYFGVSDKQKMLFVFKKGDLVANEIKNWIIKDDMYLRIALRTSRFFIGANLEDFEKLYDCLKGELGDPLCAEDLKRLFNLTKNITIDYFT